MHIQFSIIGLIKHPFANFEKNSIQKAIQNVHIYFPAPFELRKGTYEFQENVARKDFISGLLYKDISQRYGCGPKGFEEIRDHPWLCSIDWQALERKELVPDFIPDVFYY